MPKNKSVKNMSVNELIEARKGYMDKVEEIDKVLVQAVDAIQASSGVRHTASPVTYGRASVPGSYDPAFGPKDNYQQSAAASVAVSTEAPIIAPRNSKAPDHSSGFTIFDADSFARKQAEADEQYLVNNPGVAVPAEYDFNSEEVSSEISSIKEQLEIAKNNEGDTEADS